MEFCNFIPDFSIEETQEIFLDIIPLELEDYDEEI